MENILASIKKMLVGEEEGDHFDSDITMNINSVLLTVNQLGIGPSEGFVITDGEEKWKDLLGDRTDLEAVKTLIYLKVRLLFDPPTTPSVLEAMERQIQEFEWRVTTQAESANITIPGEGETEYEE